jgi:hypothetical protein
VWATMTGDQVIEITRGRTEGGLRKGRSGTEGNHSREDLSVVELGHQSIGQYECGFDTWKASSRTCPLYKVLWQEWRP